MLRGDCGEAHNKGEDQIPKHQNTAMKGEQPEPCGQEDLSAAQALQHS